MVIGRGTSLRQLRLWTIPLLAAAAFAFSAGAAAPAGREQAPAGVVGGVDRRPEGLTPVPYDLEGFETSVGSTPVVAGDPVTFELFGFKLGMSVREADRNARRRHLRFNGGNGTGPTFEGRVSLAAANLLGRRIPTVPKVLESTSMIDAEGARYVLRFLPMESGATLVSIGYFGSREGNSAAQYLAALEGRFGKPTHRSMGRDDFNVRWCSKGDAVLALCDDRPALSVDFGSDVAIGLILGSRARRDLDRRIEAQAAAVAAAQRKAPSF